MQRHCFWALYRTFWCLPLVPDLSQRQHWEEEWVANVVIWLVSHSYLGVKDGSRSQPQEKSAIVSLPCCPILRRDRGKDAFAGMMAVAFDQQLRLLLFLTECEAFPIFLHASSYARHQCRDRRTSGPVYIFQAPLLGCSLATEFNRTR